MGVVYVRVDCRVVCVGCVSVLLCMCFGVSEATFFCKEPFVKLSEKIAFFRILMKSYDVFQPFLSLAKHLCLSIETFPKTCFAISY